MPAKHALCGLESFEPQHGTSHPLDSSLVLLHHIVEIFDLVEWLKPKTCPRWLEHATFAVLPAALGVREVRYPVSTPGFRTPQITLVTTLLDAARDRADDLAALYGTRWEVETHLGQRKTTMHMDVLHGKTGLGVLKELTVLAIISNLGRLVILPAARLQQVDAARLSFLDALRGRSTSRTRLP